MNYELAKQYPKDVWTAYSQTERFGTLKSVGKTPEESVAHLWLALNKK